MRVLIEVEYDDAVVAAQRIADSLFDIEGVEGVEVKDTPSPYLWG